MSKICLVGAGNIARAHAEALRLMPSHTVTAVVDPNFDAATSNVVPRAVKIGIV